MTVKNQLVQQAIGAKEVVLSFIEALNDEDFDTARQYADDNIIFEGVMGTRHGADDYFKDMQKMKLKYTIQQVFEEEDDVCLWYDISMGGKKIFSSGWYKVEDGKIMSFKVVFDPRPLLNEAKQ